jgi:hypothetical protein
LKTALTGGLHLSVAREGERRWAGGIEWAERPAVATGLKRERKGWVGQNREREGLRWVWDFSFFNSFSFISFSNFDSKTF